MAKYEIYTERVIFVDKDCGAILQIDELWYPFRYFDDGELDIYVDHGGFLKPSNAFKLAKEIFT
jgi:hypothetical protein